MCGIICLVTSNNFKLLRLVDEIKQQLSRRGPDFQDARTWRSHLLKEKLFHFISSVLWMQGEKLDGQPIETEESIFVFNGNIYEGLSENEKDIRGDTSIFLELLEKSENILHLLSKIQGPYTFVYLNKSNGTLYFGRDHYGRISLLLGKNNEGIVLTSVAKRGLDMDFMELPSIGTFCWEFEFDRLTLLPWQYKNPNFKDQVKKLEVFFGKTIEIKENNTTSVSNQYFQPQTCQVEYIEKLKNMEVEEAFKILFKAENWMRNILRLKSLLESSLSKRINTQPGYCKNCLRDMIKCNHSTIGILFSGGIDCAVLAVLSDTVTDKDLPIDLMNVAFNEDFNYKSPDRITGLQTLSELRKLCPNREWRFLEINVPSQELEEYRKNHISDLIFPLQTVLDDSLGCALWFASRGSTEAYHSPSRVLLAGMGADELFGGYTKHRAAFKKGSWLGLHEALNLDWQNLPHRNLARDNRVACDHGRELRIPFLDENVVKFVRSLPVWEKTCPSEDLPQGFGEKLLLRCLAYHLGLKNAAVFKKRALQFGSRIANKKENAHAISHRLL